MTPRWFGRYRAVAEIGRGHIGTTYLAHADGSSAPVALKRIDPKLADDASFIQPFLEDAELVAGVDSPFVARILEAGKCTGTYFIASEYLHSEPLAETMRKSRMPLDVACRVIASAADGVHAAHDLRNEDGKLRDFIHRHLSPRTIFVGWDGTVKIVDFGIAKFVLKSVSTKPGLDRAAYLAPEQQGGQAEASVDRRADIFALGVMLYELTTGQPLFARQHPEIAKPSTIVEGYPPELESIVLRAVSPDPSDRHATAYDLARDLDTKVLKDPLAVDPEQIAAFIKPLFEEEIARRDVLLQKLGPRQSTPPPTNPPPSNPPTLLRS
jgi:serine/threonine protein kinase